MPSRATTRWLLAGACLAIGCAWAVRAWAQASEAAAAGSKAADVFLGQGPMGAFVVILLIAVGFLFWKLDRLSTTIMREGITSQQSNTAATTAGNVTLAALDRTLQGMDDGVEKLSQQTALTGQAAQSRGDEIIANQRAILARMETMQGALGRLDGIERSLDDLRRRP